MKEADALAYRFLFSLSVIGSQALKPVSYEHFTTRQFPCSKYSERARANWAQRRAQTASKRNQLDPA
jgi:hypothetical protein